MKDLIILGAGPAGISAGIYAIRGGLDVKIIGQNQSSLLSANSVENFFGFPEPISGKDLILKGEEQIVRLGGEILREEIVGISWNKGFIVITDKNQYSAKSIIIAAGKPPKKGGISNMENFKDNISYCAVCDGFFYKNKTVAVIGDGEYAVHEALILKDIAQNVYILTNGFEPKADIPENFTLITEPILKLFGEEKLKGAILKNGESILFEGLFFGLGVADSDDLGKKIGIISENGKIIVNENMMTNIPGVFAAGDCTSAFKQIAVAVADGCKAALGAISFLKEK